MLHDKQLFNKVPFQSTKYRKKELCVDNIKTIGDVYCPTCRNEKCVYVSTNKMTSFYDCKNCKACCDVLNIPFKDQKPTIMLFGGDGTHCFEKKRVVETTKKKNHLLFWRKFYANHNQAHPNVNQKRTNQVQTWNKRIRFLLADDLSNIFNFQLNLFNFTLQSTATQLTFNLQKIMIFSVSNDGIQWTLDFGPDSVTVAVIDLVQNITISSQEISRAAWQLLLSQRQNFLSNHLAQVPITPNQQGTFEKRKEVLSSVGAQDLDTSSYQVSDLEDIEFNWENSPPFLQQYLTIYWWAMDQLKTPFCWMKRKTRKMLLLQQHPSLSDPPSLTGCREVALLEHEWKMYPNMFLEICFIRYYRVCVLI